MTVLSQVDGILARQAARESSARTYARHFPIVPVRGEGMTIHAADGRTYLDCLSGAGTLALGHNHPVVVDAIRRTVDSGRPLHTLDLSTPEKDEFVTELFATLPDTGYKIQFCGPAGTDAVEAAIKLAQTATGRTSVAAFTGAYHGMTLAAMSASGGVAARTGTNLDVVRLPFPYPYRCPLGLGGVAGEHASAAYAERLLDDPNSGVPLPAAMLVEPVQGEGGVIPAPDDWLRRLRTLTQQHGVPLVVDEIQTGVGRTGTMWAHERAGIRPDVVVASKAIGGGLPLAVVLYREDLDVWEPGAHAGTFRGNVLAMAAGAATLRFVRENDLATAAATNGARLRDGLEKLTHPAIGDVRGRGLMLGVELVDPDGVPDHLGARPAASALAGRVRTECLRRGLLVELGGRHDAVLRLLPPLTITEPQVDAVLDRLADALRACE
ncbi:diaminobutyrate--2-oxoglutarate transaminase family protein [Cryptosporangium phraense]|uniref:Diaminobutyrate--2-oxoglutarate transaminase n=1 Tax=Cryptosporangium phraense TaxID=2593070 RepID=A0A545APB0_9ACTN|nr:diaminobutyrate--2-oxoglutarate transaminase family protein [Cryptosporangium phraense]TQS43123.1 aminotransferase class III-fold pyridoxal phosphate-dependent enzyme [Cryptosporangium phraense]